jgi:C4-dicarboxylate-specific signal transduction histidine kinase
MMGQLMEIMRISTLAELVSGIAHELNQPLGAIATYAQAGERMLNRSTPLIGEASEVLRQINHEALGAGEGIRRIRRLFDQDNSARVPCHMSELVREMQPLLEMLTQRIHGHLRIETSGNLPAVIVERLKVQHVLFALVQNACDASAEVKREPVIGLRVASNRYEVETSITDCGSGVPPAMQAQLFRPFYTTKPRGTGLGLASSRAIIEAHEGTIGFESVPAGGSRFWFRLPVAGR